MEATKGELKIEMGETKVDDEIMDENDLAPWYLDNPVKQHAEEEPGEHEDGP